MASTAYDDGYNSFKRGENLNANPYDAMSMEHSDWLDGWWQASDETK